MLPTLILALTLSQQTEPTPQTHMHLIAIDSQHDEAIVESDQEVDCLQDLANVLRKAIRF